MTPHEHATRIRKTLAAERAMRERVFQHDPPKQRSKMAEIDRALESLAALEALAAQQETPQGSLFGEVQG